MNWFNDREEEGDKKKEEMERELLGGKTMQELVGYAKESSERVNEKALEFAKTMSPNELTELFMAVGVAKMYHAHCPDCMLIEATKLASFLLEAPHASFYAKKKKEGIPTPSDPFSKPNMNATESDDDGSHT
jgi:hypothetical protein